MKKRPTYCRPHTLLHRCAPSLMNTFTHGTVDDKTDIGTEEGNPPEILAKPNHFWDDEDDDDANHKHDTL